MGNLWRAFEKTLWKQRQLESRDHDKICKSECQCQTYQEELHQWEDFAMENYKDATLEAMEY